MQIPILCHSPIFLPLDHAAFFDPCHSQDYEAVQCLRTQLRGILLYLHAQLLSLTPAKTEHLNGIRHESQIRVNRTWIPWTALCEKAILCHEIAINSLGYCPLLQTLTIAVALLPKTSGCCCQASRLTIGLAPLTSPFPGRCPGRLQLQESRLPSWKSVLFPGKLWRYISRKNYQCMMTDQ